MLVAAPAIAAFAAGAALPLRAAAAEPAAVTVFAAASLTDAVRDLAADFTRATGIRVQGSYAASSALARQIESGAAADIFLSADLDWMDYLQQRDLIESASRHNLVGNHLVLIAPAESTLSLKIAPHFALRAALGQGRRHRRSAVGSGRSLCARGADQAWCVGRGGRPSRAHRQRACGAQLRGARRGAARDRVLHRRAARTQGAHRGGVSGRYACTDRLPRGAHSNGEAGRVQFLAYLQGPAGRAVFQNYGFQPL